LKKIIRLTESDLIRIVKRVINEGKQVGILYHSTSIKNLFKIIEENKLIAFIKEPQKMLYL